MRPQRLLCGTARRQADAAASPDSHAVGSFDCLSRPDATFVGHAQLSGQPVIVIVSESAGQQTVEVDDVNCTVLFTRTL